MAVGSLPADFSLQFRIIEQRFGKTTNLSGVTNLISCFGVKQYALYTVEFQYLQVAISKGEATTWTVSRTWGEF